MASGMNDPHVVSLTYRIDVADTVDFDRAPPKATDRGAFRITLDAYLATVEMVDHFASVEEARKVVDPFLRAWELEVDLRDTGDRFRFVYQTAEIVDRNPPATGDVAVTLGRGTIALAGMDVVVHVGRSEWPEPPQDIAVSPDADVLWRRWRRYRAEKQESLLAAAYWALTVLEAAPGVAAPVKPRRSSKRRQTASAFFNVELDVLDRIGELTSTRGGDDESRKHEGRSAPLSPAERQWLEAAFRALVRRVAERAYHGKPPPNMLRMSDLPKLTP